MGRVREYETAPRSGSPAVEAGAPPVRPGLYTVQLDGLPRKLIDTGLPAGHQAEAVAKDRYLAWAVLGMRHRDKLVVKLEE